MRSADILDVREHPGLDAELHCPSNDGGDDLSKEHWARRDLHVVTKLKVGRERQSLRHCDVAPCLEHHHRDRSAGKHVPNNELGDNVQADLLVRNRLDHADRNDIDERWTE